MSLTIKANIKRLKPTNDLWDIKLIDQSRCIFRYHNERLSVVLFNIIGGEIAPECEASCEVTFLAGEHIASTIENGDCFELSLADTIIATGKVIAIVER